jgi:dCTP deaminase
LSPLIPASRAPSGRAAGAASAQRVRNPDQIRSPAEATSRSEKEENMILSGLEIERRLGKDIFIDPYSRDQLNPNSYNLRLHEDLLTYDAEELDMSKANPTRRLKIPAEGILLQPRKLYLGRTVEHTETHNFVPMLEGRSSVGRLGLFVHVTAGFGDVGFRGFWTLEIFAVQPIRIYPGVEICQIFYHTLQGDHQRYDGGKYQDNDGIQASMLYREFASGEKGST